MYLFISTTFSDKFNISCLVIFQSDFSTFFFMSRSTKEIFGFSKQCCLFFNFTQTYFWKDNLFLQPAFLIGKQFIIFILSKTEIIISCSRFCFSFQVISYSHFICHFFIAIFVKFFITNEKPSKICSKRKKSFIT